jgi:hypothetical protein
LATRTGTYSPFVELYNPGPVAVDLSGWSLASAVRLSFPSGTTMAPLEYVVVAAGGGSFLGAAPGTKILAFALPRGAASGL